MGFCSVYESSTQQVIIVWRLNVLTLKLFLSMEQILILMGIICSWKSNFREVLPKAFKNNVEVLDYSKIMKDSYANKWSAYRIMLTIHVSVASAKICFSKLKLIKSYLRSTMSHEGLTDRLFYRLKNLWFEISIMKIWGMILLENPQEELFFRIVREFLEYYCTVFWR